MKPLVECVGNIDELLKGITLGKTNSFGTGGIKTKIQAARKSTGDGIPMILANSKVDRPLTSLADGTGKGTLFEANGDAIFKAAAN